MIRLVIQLLTELWKISPQNNRETVESETEIIGLDKEVLNERYISSEKRQQIFDDLKLK